MELECFESSSKTNWLGVLVLIIYIKEQDTGDKFTSHK